MNERDREVEEDREPHPAAPETSTEPLKRPPSAWSGCYRFPELQDPSLLSPSPASLQKSERRPSWSSKSDREEEGPQRQGDTQMASPADGWGVTPAVNCVPLVLTVNLLLKWQTAGVATFHFDRSWFDKDQLSHSRQKRGKRPDTNKPVPEHLGRREERELMALPRGHSNGHGRGLELHSN